MKNNLTNTMICWNDKSAIVALVPWPDTADASGKFDFTDGACFTNIQTAAFEYRKTAAFIAAIHMIVRDECDPLAVHAAFLGLEEYRAGCSCDIPGSTDAMRKHGEYVPGPFDL